MKSEMLSEQRDLVELVEDAGWEVSDVELTAYESPWVDEDDPEATVTITARKRFEDESDGDDGSPFRVK